MMNMIKGFGFLVFTFLLLAKVWSQSSTGSAYNMFGLGTLKEYGLGSFESKGNAGIGARYIGEVNLKNPASLNAISGPSHVFDVGINISTLSQKTAQTNERTMIGGLSSLNLWLRMGKGTAIALGASPFSDARYDITDAFRTSEILGIYSTRFMGSGGLTQFYLAASQRIFKNFSIGVRGSLLSGTISSTQLIYNNTLVGDISLYREESVGSLVADFGAQYSIRLGERQALTIGGIYQPGFRVTADTEQKIIEGDTDSLTSTGAANYRLPEKYGIGLSYRSGGLSVNADSEVEKWSVNEEGEGFSYKDRLKGSVGFEYLKNPFSDSYFDRIAYRGGFSVDSHYLKLSSGSLRGVGGSLGLGFPVERGGGMIHVGYAYHLIQPGSDRLIRETSHKIMLNVSIRDLWFQQRKYD